MFRFVLVFLAVLALGVGSALAAEGEAPKEKPKFDLKALFDRLDENKDGKLTEAEYLKSRMAQRDPEQAKKNFADMAGEDKEATFEEYQAWMKKRMGERKPGERKPGGRRPGGQGN